MARKDSAVHVSLSCLKPVKQQQNDASLSGKTRLMNSTLN
jgi:hypothetical protein